MPDSEHAGTVPCVPRWHFASDSTGNRPRVFSEPCKKALALFPGEQVHELVDLVLRHAASPQVIGGRRAQVGGRQRPGLD